MDQAVITDSFNKSIRNKFNVYNSLFLNLPFQKVKKIGMLIPLLARTCESGLSLQRNPLEILDSFFSDQIGMVTEQEKLDFMFQVIQYIERQIVLYDSVEDSAFPEMLKSEQCLSLKDYVNRAKDNNANTKLSEKLETFSARLVFTAHPTQFYSSSVLDIMANLRGLIKENNIDAIDVCLQQLGLTSLINSSKPTPLEEAKNVIHLLRNVYYDALADLYDEIRLTINSKTFNNFNIIQLGFWPGGDRDGNPFVTSKTTAAVADELRMTLMKCYYHDVKALSLKLTFRDVEVTLTRLKNLLYNAIFDALQPIHFEQIMDPLLKIKKSIKLKYNNLYVVDLQNLIDKVNIFKTHFATLDIRQNHNVHKETIQTILIHNNLITKSLDELKTDQLISILVSENLHVKPSQFKDDLIRDTIETIAQLKNIQSKNGEQGCNRYIISNSESVFSVLFVFALLRWCAWGEEKIPFDIIPLFESMKAMKNADSIMRELFEISEYKSHIQNRLGQQTIMLGFSDGTKDGGYLQANWSIFKTKEKLSALCKKYAVQAVFFDGRGGPPARGGGKTHRFYAAQSENIANHSIQLTIQGQTITSKYGTKDHFMYNCEQLLTAALSRDIFANRNSISQEYRDVIDELSQISLQKYTDLKNEKLFIPYLEEKSVVNYYGKTNIASRPGKRGDKENLDFADLRAISFVGSWSQLKQNVPGYFGIGTAIQSLVKNGKLKILQNIYNEVPYFKALLSNSMMALYKCNFDLTGYMAKDIKFKEFRNLLYNEYKLSKEMLLLVSNTKILMQDDPVSRNSIEIREHIILPLLIIQQYALQKIGHKEVDLDKKDLYKKIVKRSLYGNINASRNSA